MMEEREEYLDIEEAASGGFRISWYRRYDCLCQYVFLGEKNLDGEHDFITEGVQKANPPDEVDEFDDSFLWYSPESAKNALREAKRLQESYAKIGTPSHWEKLALEAGWTPPEGWELGKED